MKTIGILHTIPQSIPPLKKAFDKYAGVQVLHYMDSGIVKQVAEDGALDNETQRRFMEAARHAAGEADVLVIACTLCCRYAAHAASVLGIPVLEADLPMLQAAASRYRRIGIVCTKETIGIQCRDKIALRLNSAAETLVRVASADQTEIRSVCEELERLRVDVVVLAQLSLADAKEYLSDLRCPVYTSPDFLAEAAIRCVAAEK